MSKTRQLTINSVSPTAITIQSVPGCNGVRVMESPGVSNWPTTDLLIYKDDPSVTPIRVPAGREYLEPTRGQFLKDTTPFWVQTVTGSTTLDVNEGSPI